MQLLKCVQKSVDDYNEWASRASVRYSTEYSLISGHNTLKGILYNKMLAHLLMDQHKYLGVNSRRELLRAFRPEDLICTFETGGFLSKLMICGISAQDSIRHIHGRVLLINGLCECLPHLVYNKPLIDDDLQSIVNELDNFRYERRAKGTTGEGNQGV